LSHNSTRTQIAQYLAQHGPVDDPTGRATAKLRKAIGYENTEASFTQLIANMDRAGMLIREIKGKRTYRILAGPDSPPLSVENPTDATEGIDMEYDKVASALLVQVVQTLTQGQRGQTAGGSWARRRIDRLERRIHDLERELTQAKVESKAVEAERDALRVQVVHSEGNLALLTDRLSTHKPQEGRMSNLLRSDERALLHQLRASAVKDRPDRAS